MDVKLLSKDHIISPTRLYILRKTPRVSDLIMRHQAKPETRGVFLRICSCVGLIVRYCFDSSKDAKR
jgi:hypothetical protein